MFSHSAAWYGWWARVFRAMPSISAEGVLLNRLELEGEPTELSRLYQWDRGFSVCFSLPLMSIQDVGPSLSVPFLLHGSIQSHRFFNFGILESTHFSKGYMNRYMPSTTPTIFVPGEVGCSIYMKDRCLVFSLPYSWPACPTRPMQHHRLCFIYLASTIQLSPSFTKANKPGPGMHIQSPCIL